MTSADMAASHEGGARKREEVIKIQIRLYSPTSFLPATLLRTPARPVRARAWHCEQRRSSATHSERREGGV